MRVSSSGTIAPEADRSTSTRSRGGGNTNLASRQLSGSVSGSIKRGGGLEPARVALTRVAVAVLRSGVGEPDSSTCSSVA